MFFFICHASEDQADFVRPLAEALRKKYGKVWYSEYELTLGDSLLGKIDQGLASCDYGIVVLSKSFFEKKWTRAELEGLFARETRSRKMILPIWKDITEAEVKAQSPILASRFAVSTAAGLPKVLEEIALAVSVSERQRELTATDQAVQRVRVLKQTIAERQRA
jgi:TIR domain-containing protein